MLHLFSHPVAFCCVWLGVVAQSLKPVIRFSYVRKDVTPKIVGPTMLGVVPFVCTLLYLKSFRLYKRFHGFLRNLTFNQGRGRDLENCAYALEKCRLRPCHEKFNAWPRPKSA